MKLLESVGPAVVIDYARRFGFTNPMQPYLSLALGAAEATPLQATSAYTVFPRQGVHMTPYQVLRVLDRQGNVLEENRPRAQDAIRADTAFVMTSLLQGVASRGTAAAAASLDWPVAGKTGTMDDYTDAWFIGFDPEITIGVWIGYDEKKTLGRGETGATAALPIWIDVMKARLELRGREPRPEFAAPGNIVFVSVDKAPARRRPANTPSARPSSPEHSRLQCPERTQHFGLGLRLASVRTRHPAPNVSPVLFHRMLTALEHVDGLAPRVWPSSQAFLADASHAMYCLRLEGGSDSNDGPRLGAYLEGRPSPRAG